MFRFEGCNCGKAAETAHGYISKDGSRLPVVIVSVAAARYVVDVLKDYGYYEFLGIEDEIAEQARAAGLSENRDEDIALARRFLESLGFDAPPPVAVENEGANVLQV